MKKILMLFTGLFVTKQPVKPQVRIKAQYNPRITEEVMLTCMGCKCKVSIQRAIFGTTATTHGMSFCSTICQDAICQNTI